MFWESLWDYSCRFVAKYKGGKKIEEVETGSDYADMQALMTGKIVSELLDACIKISPLDDARVYAYARFETGDEMSRRAKFAFITWIGPSVSPLKKARVSTDKAFVKQIVCVSTCTACESSCITPCVHPCSNLEKKS